MDGYSANLSDKQRAKLRELFPEVFTEDKIEWEKLRATLGDDIEFGERYGLSWKGKSGVFAKIQEKTVSTLHPQPEQSVDWDTTQNMFIEGDNLEALKVLHKAYYGKIKMIYIDPPYNTGNDFVYNDDFAKTRRQNAVDEGMLDEEGNITRDDGLRINSGGHKHSNWLDMMYPRLFLARNLLKQDGVIFVSIDDNEVHNLRLIMNEIFGEENLVGQIAWQKVYSPKNQAKLLSNDHEYILAYARNANEFKVGLLPRTDEMNARYRNLDSDSRGNWKPGDLIAAGERKDGHYEITGPTGKIFNSPPGKHWAYSRTTMNELLKDNRIFFGKDGASFPSVKQFLNEVKQGRTASNLFLHKDFGHTDEAKKEIIDLFSDDGRSLFETVKPTRLIEGLCQIAGCNFDDIIADFFVGSGTAAHAVLKLNAKDGGRRRWIAVQLPELTDEKSEARRIGYKTISDIGRERIRRAGEKVSKDFANKISEREMSLDLGFRSYVLGDSNFKKWNEQMREADEVRQATLEQLNPIEDGASDEDLLTEILLKRGISPLAKMDLHEDFIFIHSETLAISLSRHMTEELFTAILAKSPSQIILLDQAFKEDLGLKANLILQAEKQNTTTEVL